MENEIKLLECPFCGGEAEIVPCMGLLRAVRVRCARCKCSTPPVGVVTEGDKIVQLADEAAAEVWNARYAEVRNAGQRGGRRNSQAGG